MSSWGFDKVHAEMKGQTKEALREMMDAAQKEFGENFSNQGADGKAWEMVKRGVPPPILDVKGRLKSEVVNKSNTTIFSEKAVLVVDPIDERGRGYAEYHMEGNPPSASQPNGMPKREFIIQTEPLTEKQLNILETKTDKAWNVG